MEIQVRKAEKKDAQRLVDMLFTIAELHHKGRPDIYSSGSKYKVKDIENKIKNPDEIIFVAVNDDDFIIGYTMSKLFDVKENGIIKGYRKLYVDDVCVDERFRKKGVGRILMEQTKEEAKKLDCYNVELNVWEFNENAIRFYESCGMTTQRRQMEIIL